MRAPGTLSFAKTARKTNTARANGYDEANLRNAREILSDVERYGGPDAFQ